MKNSSKKQYETFEIDGKTIENKPIYMVEIFWDGDVTNRSMGNWSIMDERDKTGRYVYMSMYPSEKEAEKGYRRWVGKQKKTYKMIIKTRRKLISMGFSKLFPSVLERFDEVTGYNTSRVNGMIDDDTMQEADVSEFLPLAHKIISTDTKNMNNAFKGFYGPHYEDGKDFKGK